jgi:hypothetical protein
MKNPMITGLGRLFYEDYSGEAAVTCARDPLIYIVAEII